RRSACRAWEAKIACRPRRPGKAQPPPGGNAATLTLISQAPAARRPGRRTRLPAAPLPPLLAASQSSAT
ncbi:hypothetical protein AZZ73_001745, partial [Klebsiella pneumoniae]